MFIHVIKAKYYGDYKVWAIFNDGSEGVIDLASELYGEIRTSEGYGIFQVITG